MSDPRGVDPEEAFVASLSSCHMLNFLFLAAKAGFVLDSYSDTAVGQMEKNAEGRLAITRVTLEPQVRFSGERLPTAEELRKLHDQAHHDCFIANSVRTVVTVEGREAT
jgi:organic hydroperoxide reductase OsmC/OhrA